VSIEQSDTFLYFHIDSLLRYKIEEDEKDFYHPRKRDGFGFWIGNRAATINILFFGGRKKK
jgi:hypothetical protein